MKRYLIERVKLPVATPGSWYDKDTRDLICKTLELPWLNNQRDKLETEENEASCIPNGVYRVTKEKPIPENDKLGRRYRPYGHFRIHDVPGRQGILVHRITYVKDLLGCIGVGGRFVDLDKDGVPDIIDSGKKLQWMYENLPNEFELEIIDRP